MSYLSTIDNLKHFAERTGRNAVFDEMSYPSTALHHVVYHRRTLYIPDGSSVFVCYSDSKEMGPQGLFSGVFIPIDAPVSFTMEARKRDLLDKINLFNKKEAFKSGSPGFDSRVRIITNDEATMKILLQDRNLKNLIIDGLNVSSAMVVAINAVNVNFVPLLKGMSHLGVYTQMTWIEDRNIIEKLFSIINSP